jgi:hypothetical protein
MPGREWLARRRGEGWGGGLGRRVEGWEAEPGLGRRAGLG